MAAVEDRTEGSFWCPTCLSWSGSQPPDRLDDGRSTLIGRLLCDTKTLFEDQLAAGDRSSQRYGQRSTSPRDRRPARRWQRTTIDVTTATSSRPGQDHHRRYPGPRALHAQRGDRRLHADATVVLGDARSSLVEQSRRHAFLATLGRIPHLVVCLNKMDLGEWSQARFEEIKAELEACQPPGGARPASPRPRRCGGTTSSTARPTCRGTRRATLLHHLEQLSIASGRTPVDCRLPVQSAARPRLDAHHDRGYAGQIAGAVCQAWRSRGGAAERLGAIAAIDGPDGPVDAVNPRCRWSCASQMTSTPAGATCPPVRTTRRPSPKTSRPPCAR